MMFDFTKSLKGRLAIYFALAITVSLLISGLAAAALVQRYLKHQTVEELLIRSESLAAQIENEGLPLNRYLADLERVNGIRALIVPYDEQSLSLLPMRGQRGDEAQLSGRLPVIDWDKLKSGGTQVAETRLPGFEGEVLVAAHGVTINNELAGAVVLTKPVQSLQSWLPLAGWILVAAAISLTVSLLLAFLMARRLSQPLHQITLAASAVAEGDFSHEISVQSQDEIGRLADAFRYMSDEVQKSQDQQRQFVINVSHELKTPLTSIAGHAQALSDGVATDPADVTKSLEVINSQTRRLSRLIEDLLSLAKFDARQFELKKASLPLADSLESLADGFSFQAEERGVSLSVEADPAVVITTDPDRLRQILSNLVQNALSHTPEGGHVSITARPEREGKVAIGVADSGRGIEPEDLPHVFDRFYRAGGGARDAGLGLGLSISRELARALGGDITASSTPGEGSKFTVTLPG